MKNKQDKKAVAIGLFVGIGFFVVYIVAFISALGLIFGTIFKGDSYYKADKNETPEQVEKYLDNYLYQKYGKRFELTFEDKYKRDFCVGGGLGCFGTDHADEMYNFIFTATDEEGRQFDVTYYCAYYEEKELHKEIVEDGYAIIIDNDNLENVVKNMYETYHIESYYDSITLIIYDELFNVDNYNELIHMSLESDVLIVFLNEENMYKSLLDSNSSLKYITSIKSTVEKNGYNNYESLEFDNEHYYVMLNVFDDEYVYIKSK